MANSVDPDETPCSAASHLGLHCLLRPVCPNTYSKYGINVIVISAIFTFITSCYFPANQTPSEFFFILEQSILKLRKKQFLKSYFP